VPKSPERYQAAVDQGLDRAWRAAPVEDVEIGALRVALLSDQHRGARDGADDFERCEPAYGAALGWYREQGFGLWLLGDVEELWENGIGEVMPSYRDVLALEREFGDGLRRLYGNHDLDWSKPRHARRHLPGIDVREALRLRVRDGGAVLGTLFCVHGHQGTAESDRFAFVSRFVVRRVWRPVQRLHGFLSTTPAEDLQLRSRHDAAMYSWAKRRPAAERPVLIAGHTHRPVFPGDRLPPPDLPALEQALRDARASGDREAVAAARAALEQARAIGRRKAEDLPPVDPPCYFNTGCCCFPDRMITGLEIADGELRLVRWRPAEGRILREVRRSAPLRDVLAQVAAG
jgi:hypothetical protein